MKPTREKILEKAARVPAPPVAIEALWDGDTNGWGVVLTMVYPDASATPAPYGAHTLAFLRGDGGDMRVFNGHVPPWAEAVHAKEVGEELAARLGIPFFFPSPEHPEDHCPRWWEKDQGYPCARCGILLLQRDPCPWRGVCYYCHLAQEREKKEAALSPEDRAGPRCHICGDPARGAVNGAERCASCLDRYEDYECAQCGVHVMILKTAEHTDICSDCDLRQKLAEVSEADRQAIRAAAEGGDLAGIREARRLLGWALYDAHFAVLALTGRI